MKNLCKTIMKTVIKDTYSWCRVSYGMTEGTQEPTIFTQKNEEWEVWKTSI